MHPDLRAFIREVWTEFTKRGGVIEQLEAESNERMRQRRNERRMASRMGRAPVFKKGMLSLDDPNYGGPGSAEIYRRAVYGLYNASASRATCIDDSEVLGWLNALDKLSVGKVNRSLQCGGVFKDFDYALSMFRAEKAEPLIVTGLTTGFIHFINPNSPGPARKRIYINVQPKHALALMGGLLGWLTGGRSDDEALAAVGPPRSSPLSEAAAAASDPRPEFCSCKIAAPLSLGKRDDAILVYCPDQPSVNAVIDYLKSYSDPAWFRKGTPRLTLKPDGVPDGVGVATGDEPPQVATGLQSTNRQSFGSLRAELIAAAMLEAEFSERVDPTNSEHFDIFRRRV